VGLGGPFLVPDKNTEVLMTNRHSHHPATSNKVKLSSTFGGHKKQNASGIIVVQTRAFDSKKGKGKRGKNARQAEPMSVSRYC